jgi:hypothetical protein
VQVAPDRGQRDVDDGDVEPGDEQAQAADRQDADPAVAAKQLVMLR